MSWAAIGAIEIAGLFIEFVSGAAGAIILITGVVTGGTRALAILLGETPSQVEWMTAVGFAVGIAISLVVFALDLLWG
jgi:hypothetical protein